MADEAELDYALLDRAGGAVFHARSDPGLPPAGASDHLIEVAPGVSVAARFYPIGRAQPVVLFFHGNGEVVGDHDHFAPLYHAAGLSLFVAEYRGYGKSGGRPSMAALIADARAVAAYFHALLDAGGYSGPRFVMGRSLGSQPALELAARDGARFAGVIIESGASSVRRMLARHGLRGSAEGERLAAAHEAKLRSIRLPTLQLHGERDDLVPLAQAEELYDLFEGTQRELVVVSGAGHNDILWRGQRGYFEAMRAFVARAVDGTASDAVAPGGAAADAPPGKAARSRRARSARGLVELARGVYVYALPGGAAVNAGIVAGTDAVAVIDSGAGEADARALRRAIASVTDVPVRYVVNTHHHGAHCLGNWWFLPATIVGHARCRVQLLDDAGAAQREAVASRLPAIAEQVRAAPLVPPAFTFAHGCALDLGGVALRVVYCGRGHTDNDIAVVVEGAGVAFAGDLIGAGGAGGAPDVDDSYPAQWGATLRTLLATGAERYVPGHGAAVDASAVAEQARAFDALCTTCAVARSADEALHTLPHAALAAFGEQAPAIVRRYFETAAGDAVG